MRRLALGALTLGLLSSPPLAARSDWLPPETREAMAQEIAAKLVAIDVEGGLTEEQALEPSRVGVAALAERAESLGVESLVGRAPTYPDLELPVSGQVALDAIAAYGMCSFAMEAVYEDETPREGRLEQRTTATFMSMSIVIISAYLRPHYLAAGVTDEQAEAFLAGEGMNDVAYRVQTERELLQYTMNRCAGPLTVLME
jgi:hypothetical protein